MRVQCVQAGRRSARQRTPPWKAAPTEFNVCSTEAASARAESLGIALHFSFPAGAALPQVGDYVGIARGGPRSRFVVREREFLWDGDVQGHTPSAVLLMLDLADGERDPSDGGNRPA